jgi:hypothetical protein
MPIFITNEAQKVLTYHIQKGHKLIPGALKWILGRYLTSDAPPRLILLHINCPDNLCSLFQIFTCQNFWHSKSTDRTRLIHGVNFYVHSPWNSTFFGNSTNWLSPFTVNNVMNVIFTAQSSQKYCLPSRSHPLNCPFYPKIFYSATFTLMNDSRNNVFPTD